MDYELIDAGGAARLERFGEHVVDRPYPGALDAPQFPDRWPDADLRFDRETGWTGTGVDAAREGWSVEIDGLRMELRPTDAGQVGAVSGARHDAALAARPGRGPRADPQRAPPVRLDRAADAGAGPGRCGRRPCRLRSAGDRLGPPERDPQWPDRAAHPLAPG
ncbi:MAG: hypothetical protein WKF78_14575 [Candidatus Limnocylindrales bacterium]